MNATPKRNFDWRADLNASRDVSRSEQYGYTLLLEWFENWRMAHHLPPSRETAVQFWRAQISSKERESWQMRQWAEAIRWYLQWLSQCIAHGNSGMTLEERVRAAVQQAGCRRSHAKETRKAYSQRVGAFARWVGERGGKARALMDPKWARDWLTSILERLSQVFRNWKGVFGFNECSLRSVVF